MSLAVRSLCHPWLLSIKGSPLRWLDAALDRGDSLTAWSVAHEFPRGRLSLDYALALLVLVTDEPDRYERGAARWLDRWSAETPGATHAERRRLAKILDGLPDLEALTALADLCDEQRLPRTASTLEHLYPTAL